MSASGIPAFPPPTLLCVANYPANTGYAWDFIEGLYARVSDALAPHGVRTLVAYPELGAAPRPLEGSNAIAVEMDFGLNSAHDLRRALDFVRNNNVVSLYLTDRVSTSPHYAVLRMAGVRHIVVHDHTSGARSVNAGPKQTVKWLYARLPGFTADSVLCVSDYVARRQVQVGRVPEDRVLRVWNGIPVAPETARSGALREVAGAEPGQPIIACCCRADAVKGVHHLFTAFDAAARQLSSHGINPVLAYIGDGPEREALATLRDSLEFGTCIRMIGYHNDARELLADATVCVVPSVWQDAFPLGVLEPMAAGRPVIATAVGGIPEMIEDRVTGLLVPPGDEDSLTEAIVRLLRDSAERERLGKAARQRVADRFTYPRQIGTIAAVIGKGLGIN